MHFSGRAFLILLLFLAVLAVATQPAILTAVLPAQPTPAGTPTLTPTPTATPTLDPLAAIPVATTVGQAVAAYPLPTLPPAAAQPAAAVDIIAPTPLPVGPTVAFSTVTATLKIPPAPTPAGVPPDRIVIPRLNLDAPVEPAGMVPSTTVPGVAEWAIPDHRAAGWLNTSAAFGRPGNTVLAGHHNIYGEVFRGLWDLAAGDEIVLYAGEQARRYRVERVLILPEKNEPLAVRLANARYIQPTGDERLTLVTCWPYENNTHRTIVIAYPSGGRP